MEHRRALHSANIIRRPYVAWMSLLSPLACATSVKGQPETAWKYSLALLVAIIAIVDFARRARSRWDGKTWRAKCDHARSRDRFASSQFPE